MALTTKRVVNDSPSEVLQSLRIEFNNLLDAIEASTDYATLKSGMEAGVKKIATTLELPRPPVGPTV